MTKKTPHPKTEDTLMERIEEEEQKAAAEKKEGAPLKQEQPQIDPKDTTIKELTNNLQRLQAEFENFKKRTEKEKAEFQDYADAKLLAALLPVADSFELAFKSKQNPQEFIKGMELLHKQFLTFLEKNNLRPILGVGKQFNPHLQEVLLQETTDQPDGVVLDILQKGYMIKDKILRFAKVKVSKKKEEQHDNQGDTTPECP
ncbi:nucleotide exchange factor GrpE [Candidatus Woesearchaeota archaeon]|nr:nucleotide exchange factor GrpE [Candidatus Woesearchaeota archaeon]